MSDLPQIPAPRCIHLCSKALMVHGESFADDPAYQAGFDHAWCGLTGRPLGPDDDDVAWDRCSDRERPCYKEF